MAVVLNKRGFEFAKSLIAAGRFVYDERDAWSEHQPSAAAENAFIREHGYGAFGDWHLGINDEKPADTKGHYEFPYGDFEKAHRCGNPRRGEPRRPVQALRHRETPPRISTA